MVPAEWMEVLSARDAVEPRVKHNSCDTLKEWAKNSCVTMVLDGTGGPFSSDIVLRRCGWGVTFLDFNDVFAQTVPRSEVYAEIQALRFARKTPLILVSDNEYFVSTAQRGRTNPVEPCSDLWHQYWVAVEYHSAAVLVMKVKSRGSEWSLWSGHQPLRMYAGTEIGDRLAANGAEASGQDGAEARRHCHPAHADQYPNKSIQVSCVAVPRKRAPLEECIRLSAHEIVAGRRIGSVKCTQCLQVCGKKQLVACLASNHVRTVASKGCALHPFAAWASTPRDGQWLRRLHHFFVTPVRSIHILCWSASCVSLS